MGNNAKFETFLSGCCSFWYLNENQEPVCYLKNIHFRERIVGSKRNYLAMQAGVSIQKVIRVPMRDPDTILSESFAVIGEKQYKVEQVQMIPDTIPRTLDITLAQPDLLLSFHVEEAGPGGRY